jgi:DNA-binding SARP family transcriptional activator/tetratricopeptide (TPR) repeat protein
MEFRILGPLEIRQNEHAVTCKGAKQRLLLAVLLLHANEVVSNDRLIEALWGEHPPPTAAKALQMHVSQLRRLLEPDLIATRPPGYQLRVEREQLDLAQFEAAVGEARAAAARGQTADAAARLADALALWRGPPLADLTFEEFLRPEITRLEELHMVAIEDRIDAELALARHAALVPELEAVAAEHPLRERVRGQLMLALYRSGRQAEALDVYRDTRRLLVDELGLEPGRELKALEQQILDQDPKLDLPVEASAEAALDGATLVGRDKELAELLPVLASAAAGRGAAVLIGGEPGIGKSRLAESLARHAAAQGVQVVVGRCWEAGGAPAFWPWEQALRGLRGGARDELAALLGEPAARNEDDPGGRFRMFAAVVAFLRAAAAVAPVALFLDDIHAADPPSLVLLRFVASQIADMPVLVVACFRDTESGGDLGQALAELAREPVVRRMTLGGLDSGATSELLATVMGEEPAPALVARVYAETRGNPLFAGEIGRLLGAEGEPHARDHLPIPDGVREAIGLRLERQSPDCRDLLVRASVLGREFDLAALLSVGGRDEEEMLSALDEAGAARLVSDVPGAAGRIRFSHILIRDAVYDALPVSRRLRLHREIGETLERLYAGNVDPYVAELAYHFIAAGSPARDKAVAYSERAGQIAAARYAYEEAARHYADALGLLEQQGGADPERVCDLLLCLGEALSRAGDAAAAKRILRRAATVAGDNGWDDRLVRAAIAYGGRFAWVRSSTDPALVPLLEQALAVVDDSDARSRTRLLARVAAAMRDDPRREPRARMAAQALEIGRQSGDALALAYALEGYGVVTEGFRPAEHDLPLADELIALGTKLGDLERVYTGRDFRLNALWKLADRPGIDVEIETLTALADDLHQPGQQWSAKTETAILALMEGRFAEAEQLIADTLAMGERAERWNATVSARLQLFVLHRARGRLAEIEDMISRGVHEYPTLIRFRCALAHLYAELGDLASARAAIDDVAARDPTGNHIDPEWLFTVSLLPDVYRALDDGQAAAGLYDALVPYEHLYAQAPIEATFGSVARALGVLAATGERFDDAERHFAVAIETERRMRARPWLAHAQHDLADTLLKRDRDRDGSTAAGLLEDAIASYRELGMDVWADRATALLRTTAR